MTPLRQRFVEDMQSRGLARTTQRSATFISLTIAHDPNTRAGDRFFAILHTWEQNLLHYPHVHCVVQTSRMAARARRMLSRMRA